MVDEFAKTDRRGFIGSIATGVAAAGVGSLAAPLQAYAGAYESPVNSIEAEEWFKKIKGKHRVVFDATEPHEILTFAWPRVFLLTNEKTGTPASDCSVVVVLRHSAIPFAMESKLWEKYKFGEMFKVDDPKTKAPALRNPFWQPAAGDFSVPGIGAVSIGINELQESGVMFCVCDMAMTVYSAVASSSGPMDASACKKEWLDGLLPGIMPMPSGVWALGRAQENKCAYIFAG